MSRSFWGGFWLGLGKPVGWLAAWILFWIGHVWSQAVIANLPDEWECVGMAAYQIYNRAMCWSLRINDTFGLKVWTTPDSGNEVKP